MMSSDLGLTYLGQTVNKPLVSACYVYLYRPHLVLLMQHMDHFALRPQKWWFIREGGGGGNEGLTADTAWKWPERPWTTARTMEVLRRCPLAIAQLPVHCTIAVSTAALGQSQRQCLLHCCWGTTRSKRSSTFAAQLHLPTQDLFWANLKVQLHLLPLDLLISPGTLQMQLMVWWLLI